MARSTKMYKTYIFAFEGKKYKINVEFTHLVIYIYIYVYSIFSRHLIL